MSDETNNIAAVLMAIEGIVDCYNHEARKARMVKVRKLLSSIGLAVAPDDAGTLAKARELARGVVANYERDYQSSRWVNGGLALARFLIESFPANPVRPVASADAGGDAGKQYAERNAESLGKYYLRHVEAMTAEGLHAKNHIAAELAYRDKLINGLRVINGFWVDRAGEDAKARAEAASKVGKVRKHLNELMVEADRRLNFVRYEAFREAVMVFAFAFPEAGGAKEVK